MAKRTIPQLPIANALMGREYIEIVQPTQLNPDGNYVSLRARVDLLANIGTIQGGLDSITNIQGSVVFRGALNWQGLPPSTAGFVLSTQGPGADPQWVPNTAGSVTSVGLALPASVFSVTGSPVTTTGTLTGSFIDQPANTMLAGPPNGAAAAPTFRAIVNADISAAGTALTRVSDTNVTLTLGGSPATALLNATSLTLGWSGQLAVPRGGTGAASFTPFSVVCGGVTTTDPLQSVASVGTTGQALLSNGPGALPSFQTVATALGQALTKVDDTNVTLTLGGTPATALLAATSLTLGWTGQLGVPRGGTGLATVAQGDLLYGSASNVLSALPKNTSATRYLSNTGTSNNPAWAQINLANGVTGTLPVASGGTGLASGTSGGILGFTGPTTLASSVALTQHAIVLGGGPGATPSPLGSLGTATTVLHGNASGPPAFAQVNLTSTVTGILPVANGGSGIASATPYAVLCGGTSATGPFQSIAGVGTMGQVLTSNGPGTLPTFQSVSGTGDVVGPASATDDAVVLFNGTTGKLIKDSAILATAIVTLTGAQTLTNKDISSSTNIYRAASDTVTGAIEIAVQSEMETGTSTTLAVTPGRQQHHPGHPKGWCQASNSGTANAQYNVSSVTDAGTGQAVVNWNIDFSSGNYAANASIQVGAERIVRISALAAGSVSAACQTTAGSFDDPVAYHVIACGDQS